MSAARAWASLALAGWLCLLAGCAPSPKAEFRGSDISDAGFDARFELTDHNGAARALDDFRGKVVVLFFGYAHCPDVCPTTLSDSAAALAMLRADEARRVQVLFVSVDPERDSAEMLRHYVPYFHASFLGLRGTSEQVAAAARAFRVTYRKHAVPGVGGYAVDHTAGSFVLDARGRARLSWPYGAPAEDMAHDLRLLLAGA